jgi:hypothetical protein
VIILDGNQNRLRHADWLIKIFQEPYSKVYAAESVDDWMKAVRFEPVQTEYIGWINQVTCGIKPMGEKSPNSGFSKQFSPSPQNGILGLYKPSPPARTNRKSRIL